MNPAQVAEEHRRVHALAAEPGVALLRRAREHLVDDGVRDEAREDLARACALERRAQPVDQQRADEAERQAHERRDEGHDPAAVEEQLRDDGVGDARGERDREPDPRPHHQGQQRRQQRESDGDRDVDAAPARAQRRAGEQRRYRVRVDLGPVHLAARPAHRVDVLQRGRRGAYDDDLVAEATRRHVAERDVGEVLVRHVAGRPEVVDPHALAAKPVARQRPAHALDDRDGECVEAVDLLRHAAQHAAAVLGQQPVARACAREREPLLAAEDVRLAVLADLGRAEDDVAGAPRREDQPVVGARIVGLLGELDVVGDHARMVGGDVLEHRGEAVARERPTLVERVERDVVGADHDQVPGRALPAQAEARVDGVQLGLSHDVGQDEPARGGRRDQRDADEHPRLERSGHPAISRLCSTIGISMPGSGSARQTALHSREAGWRAARSRDAGYGRR